jgi:hypothetical protein
MTIVGSSFTKIDVEREKPLQGKVSINNNIAIVDAKKEEMNMGNNPGKGIKFKFDYTCSYEPGIGHIKLMGEMLTIETEEVRDKILKSWKDKREVPKDYLSSILNALLTKCNIQSLTLSQAMNLPPPIPMPKINDSTVTQKKDSKK